jgi:glucokinase
MLVDPDGHPCGCGRRGCWEQYASGSALERMAREGLSRSSVLYRMAKGDASKLEGPMVTDAARAGDAYSLEIIEKVATWIGLGLASLVNILEPDRIAVGGGLSSDWDLFADTASESMRGRMEAPDFRPVPEIVGAELGADAGIVGAALLVLDEV